MKPACFNGGERQPQCDDCTWFTVCVHWKEEYIDNARPLCPECSGSGEGQTDVSLCGSCHGGGTTRYTPSPEDWADFRKHNDECNCDDAF